MSVVDMKDPIYTAKDTADWKTERPDQECPFEVGGPKVQCYAATTTIAEQIMNVVIANNLDITDVKTGNNIMITKIPNKDPLKTRYTVTAEIKATKAPIPTDYKLPDLSKMGKVNDYATMVKMLGEGPASDFAALLPANAGGGTHTIKEPPNTAWDNKSADAGDEDLAASMRKQLDA